jgi:O-methyltransferase
MKVTPRFWGTAAEPEVLDAIRALGERVVSRNGAVNAYRAPLYAADNMLLFNRTCAFLNDDRFTAAFNRSHDPEDPHDSIAWRRHIECWAARQCMHVEGDFIDCGAYKGNCCAMVMDYVGFAGSGRKYLLIDTFELQEGPDRSAMPELGAGLHAAVVARFADQPQVDIVKGYLPDVLKTIALPEKIAYLNVSLGQVKPTLATISELFPRLSVGGMVIIESYGHALARYADIQPTMDYWAASVGHTICEMPTGQGLLVKHG